MQTQAAVPVTAQDLLSANDTYGETTESDGMVLRDESTRYRTDDSRRLEPVAVRAAEEMLRAKLMLPETLQIKDCVVSNCADDGECTYYDVSFRTTYSVPSGETIDGDGLFSVGVRKDDESTFDASKDIARVLKAYTIFQKTELSAVTGIDADQNEAYAAAAKQIALSHLKHTDSGKVLSGRAKPNGSVDSMHVWEILCEGENDYGMRIPDVYTVYLYADGDKIEEVDPADFSADNF